MVKSMYEDKISTIETENSERVTQMTEELNHTKEVLAAEQRKLTELHTEHVLIV